MEYTNIDEALYVLHCAEHDDVVLGENTFADFSVFSDIVRAIAADCTPAVAKELARINGVEI